jgi:hypothetical protein
MGPLRARSSLTKGDIIHGFVIGDIAHNGGSPCIGRPSLKCAPISGKNPADIHVYRNLSAT